jgi:hypothetical protein
MPTRSKDSTSASVTERSSKTIASCGGSNEVRPEPASGSLKTLAPDRLTIGDRRQVFGLLLGFMTRVRTPRQRIARRHLVATQELLLERFTDDVVSAAPARRAR